VTLKTHSKQTVLFTVSREVAQAAIAQVASCEACNPDAAEFPFERILDRVMMFSGMRGRNQRLHGSSGGGQSLQRSYHKTRFAGLPWESVTGLPWESVTATSIAIKLSAQKRSLACALDWHMSCQENVVAD
jgi:hypothetical protein